MAKKQKRPRDPNQLARQIVDEATGQLPATEAVDSTKNRAAVELGRRGGLRGGLARAEKLTKQQRSEIARKAAQSRWRRPEDDLAAET